MEASEIYPLFSTPVYRSEINLDITSPQKKILELEYVDYAQGSGSISKKQNILEDETFSEIKKKIESHLDNYLYNYLRFKKVNYFCSSSWINVHDKNGFSPLHGHPNSVFSGVFYLKVPNIKSGNIIFKHSPELPTYSTFTVDPSIEEYNIYNSKSFFFSPQEKTILIFPSHTQHYVELNTTNSIRYSLAFNYFFKGEICSDRSKELIL